MKNTLALVLLFLLSSCVTPVMEEANEIKLITFEQKSEFDCSFISLIYGGSLWAMGTGQAVESSMNETLNNAYQKGANAVYVRAMDSTTGGTGVVAEALSCKFN